MDLSEVHFKKRIHGILSGMLIAERHLRKAARADSLAVVMTEITKERFYTKGGSVQRWGDDGSCRWIEDMDGWSCFYLGRKLNNLTYGSMVLKACRGAKSPLSARIISAKLEALDVSLISAALHKPLEHYQVH